jgi:hypothetical protein
MPQSAQNSTDLPEVDVDEIMERIRRELAAEEGSRDESTKPGTGAPSKPVRCVDLLAYEDELFLKHAYRTVLHRLPEPEGLEFWLFKLREAGWPKIEILWSIRSSKEGRIHNTQLPGLKTRYALHAAKRFLVRIPFLGWLLRLGLNILRLPRIHETVSRLERRRLAGMTRQEHEGDIREDLDRLGRRVDELEERIAAKDGSAAADRRAQ